MNKIRLDNGKFSCPICGYEWEWCCDLDFDEDERVPCCPECGELIEDGDDGD